MTIDEGGVPTGGLSDYISGKLHDASNQVARGRQSNIQPTISIDERMLEWPTAIRESFSRFRVRELLEEARTLSVSLAWVDKSIGMLQPPNYGLYLRRVKKTFTHRVWGIAENGIYYPQTGPDRGGYFSKPLYGWVHTDRGVPVTQTTLMVVEAAPELGSALLYSCHLHQEGDHWSRNFRDEDRQKQNLDMYLTSKTRVQSPGALMQMIGDEIVRERKEALFNF